MTGNKSLQVAVVGDYLPKFVAQESIETALQHSAAALGVAVAVEWFGTDAIEGHAAELLGAADAVWCAPGSPYVSMEGALEAIRFARETARPFLGTCAGFQHGVIEFARDVLGVTDAHHAEYGPGASTPLFIDELLCSLVGQAMQVRLVDEHTAALYGASEAIEQYYCRFGLNEIHLPALEQAGLGVAGIDAADGTTRIMRIADHPFFYLTLFVPQSSSTPDAPHPIVTAYAGAALQAKRRSESLGA